MIINIVADFFNNLKAKLTSDAELAASACPPARLKQIEARSKENIEAGLIDSSNRQKNTVREVAIRWSTNPEGFVRQDIRKPHQMAGNQSNFEIDPMAKLD
jgi:hypothetical protein